jgi:hypothetical protein
MPVDTKSESLKAVESDLELVNALWGGTRAMREAGKTYLPKEPKEKEADYKNRLNRSTLTNMFRKTIVNITGKVGEDEIKVNDDAEAESFAESVDEQGRDLHRFALSTTKKTLKSGMSFILIDAPVSEESVSLADEVQNGIRPYWVEIDRKNLIGWQHKDGVFTQVRIKETVEEQEDEYSTNTVEQIRVIEPNRVRLYRKQGQGKGKWALHDEFTTTIGFVPLVPVYASQDAFMESDPPFMDLAWLNVEHWQKSSDQSNILHVARVPILFGAGIQAPMGDDGKPATIEVSPNSFVSTSTPQATLQYVEHSGAAISAGRDDLKDIEDRAAALGAEFVIKKPGSVTATEKAIDEAGAHSEISAFALGLQDALELAMDYTMIMKGGQFTGSVHVNTDYGVYNSGMTPEVLLKMRAAREISRETYFRLLNELTGFEVDAKSESELIEDDAPLSLE